jgi:SAM-dependent methyltransferase
VSEELVPAELFDEDYLWFMEEQLEARSDAQVELILRLLELPAGAEVLDAPCGHGRIANRVAGRGWRVAGLDSSRLFLDIARERAPSGVEYVEGDLRDMPFEGQFDAAINWFSSFGYFDDEGNRRVLAGFRRALKPGGRLLIEQRCCTTPASRTCERSTRAAGSSPRGAAGCCSWQGPCKRPRTRANGASTR